MTRTYSYTAVPLVGWLLLGTSWVLLYCYVLVGIAWTLTPFDAVPPERIPPGWQQDLNLFFLRSGTDAWLPLGIVGMSIAFFTCRVSRGESVALKRFILSNLGYVAAASVLGSVIAFLPLHLMPPPGYGYVIKFLLKDFMLLGILLQYQAQRS